MSTTTIELRNGNGVSVDYAAVLKTLNLNPSDPKTQAAILICDRYGLDPLLKHVILIQGTPYVTRDGYLHLAHLSHQLDGLEVLEESETQTHWLAKVAVYRKDMGHPFTYVGRYPKGGSNKQFGPEMAITRAETHALRRAFSVTGVSSYDEVFDAESRETATASVDQQRGLPAPAPEAVTAVPSRPQAVDAATGEVKVSRPVRRPPNNAAAAQAAVSDETRLRLSAAIGDLGPDGRDWLEAQAANRGIGNVGGTMFTPRDVPVVEALLRTAAGMDGGGKGPVAPVADPDEEPF